MMYFFMYLLGNHIDFEAILLCTVGAHRCLTGIEFGLFASRRQPKHTMILKQDYSRYMYK